MTIRSLAGAGALALASALVFGWGAGSALAKPAEQASSSGTSYPLAMRGNVGGYSFSNGEGCNYCSSDNYASCECIFLNSGTATTWSWGPHPYTQIGYTLEVDYLLSNTTSSGTGGSCATAIGGISVEGTFSPNELVAETTGTICDTQNSNLTYSGSYIILNEGEGIFADAAGSGALTFGLSGNGIEPTVAQSAGANIYGQLQMTGNLSLTTTAPSSCGGVAGAPAC